MIEIQGLTKKFGNFTAVDHIDLTIETGEFFGLLGPNGAGKTTTISMLCTVLLPTEGQILLDGKKLDRRAHAQKRRLSVITQEYSMRQDMTIDQVMEYQGRLYFMKKQEIRAKTEELLDFAGLLEYRGRTVRHLSGGMKRKVMICRALMTNPDVLLLDEPTAGMDALSRRQTWTLLRRLQSSRVALMDRGRIDTCAPPQVLIEELGRYAVDEITEEKTVSRYFHDREEAIRFLETAGPSAALRAATLEDVFIERLGGRKTGK